LHARKVTKEILDFVKEREISLIAWNPWAMGSLGGMMRDYVFRILELWKMQASSTTSPSNEILYA
jgi:aryl-alcohol dehydrogenase-like predicted oxidoreductase